MKTGFEGNGTLLAWVDNKEGIQSWSSCPTNWYWQVNHKWLPSISLTHIGHEDWLDVVNT